jgi:uncharacterized membrane protein YphA (DoxX/SURF4 family)
MTEDGRGLRIALYVVSGLLTALYLFAGMPKVMGNAQAAEGFAKLGYSDAFRLFIGASEIAGGIALWLPKLAFWAALGLAIIMVGAIYTHVSLAEAPTGATIALILLLFIAWQRRRSALFLS